MLEREEKSLLLHRNDMNLLTFREPLSSWTHLIWLLAALLGSVPLWRRAGTDVGKRLGVVVFAGSLLFCSAGSFLFHAVPEAIAPPFRTMDHIGIYLLIAGTVTPIGLLVLDGWWRRGLLSGIWLLASLGIGLRLLTNLPMHVLTVLYLFMGWVGCATYFELTARLSPPRVRLLWQGGLLYTVGAVLNGLHWPVLIPNVFEAHEVFHLFVMAGSLCHYLFILWVVLPYEPAEEPMLEPAVLDAQAM